MTISITPTPKNVRLFNSARKESLRKEWYGLSSLAVSGGDGFIADSHFISDFEIVMFLRHYMVFGGHTRPSNRQLELEFSLPISSNWSPELREVS